MMARYCSLTSYKKLLKSLTNAKNKCLKDLKITKNDQEAYIPVDKRIFSDGFITKLIGQITKLSELQSTTKVLTTISSRTEDNRSNNSKYIKTKTYKRELHKLWNSIQRQAKNKNVLWATAGVSAAQVGTNTQATTPEVGTTAEAVLDPIPEPPPIPQEIIEEFINPLNALGEPTLESLGLGGYSPVGLAQQAFEMLHVHLGLDWWAAIAVGTLIIRIFLFPLVILAQRNAAKMNNCLPQMQAIQLKMTEARQTGNQLDAARYAQELMLFMKEKNFNPLKNMLVPLAQMPIFVSVFMGLRQMANVPVESLRTGGMLWFTDLTLADQYYLLPIITSATLWATIELGTDAGRLSSQQAVLMKYVMRALPLVVLPFTLNFPGAILCYWVSSNFISLAQVGFLRIPKVRDYFNIEPLAKFDPQQLPMKPKGFREGLKDSWTNMKLTKEFEERRRVDEIRFQKAGKGPITKTFKYDPTKQSEPVSPAPISAKKNN